MNGIKVRDIAARLNVSEKTVYKWLKNGILPATRLGKTWIVTEQSLVTLLNPAKKDQYQEETKKLGDHLEVNPRDTDKLALEKFFSLMNGSFNAGIEAILGPRSSDPDTSKIIGKELELCGKEIRLMGVGLREFFGERGHTGILRSMADDDRDVSLKAILVDPVGKFARARSVLEDGVRFHDEERFRIGSLYSDSWRSLNVIVALKNKADQSNKFKMDARFVDYWPSVYMVMTDNCCFVETYHFGKPDDAIDGSSIDGIVPIIRVSKVSEYYKVLRHHFDYVWSGINHHISVRSLSEVAQSMEVNI
ncbi:MAG: helix-turn-helix domain-containing protein [Dehalococcoidia bacterium]|nr:helix-turn-helix domain-containing protein [Dehalococcoidia bacterium]